MLQQNLLLHTGIDVQLTKNVLTEVLGQPPVVEAIHAGLECGILSVKYPSMQLASWVCIVLMQKNLASLLHTQVSFGPTIHGAHTPEERLCIPTVQPYWDATVGILEAIAQERPP